MILKKEFPPFRLPGGAKHPAVLMSLRQRFQLPNADFSNVRVLDMMRPFVPWRHSDDIPPSLKNVHTVRAWSDGWVAGLEPQVCIVFLRLPRYFNRPGRPNPRLRKVVFTPCGEAYPPYRRYWLKHLNIEEIVLHLPASVIVDPILGLYLLNPLLEHVLRVWRRARRIIRLTVVGDGGALFRVRPDERGDIVLRNTGRRIERWMGPNNLQGLACFLIREVGYYSANLNRILDYCRRLYPLHTPLEPFEVVFAIDYEQRVGRHQYQLERDPKAC